MSLYDAFGKQILPGDTILYPLLTEDETACITSFTVAAIDEWEWTPEARTWLTAEYGHADFASFQFYVTVPEEGPPDPEAGLPQRWLLAEPTRAIVVSGLDLGKRHQTPQPDISGFWHKPVPRAKYRKRNAPK